MSTRSIHTAATTTPARPTHVAGAAPHVLPVDASSASSHVRYIDSADAVQLPEQPIDPSVTIEKVGKCMQIKNLYSSVKVKMLT